MIKYSGANIALIIILILFTAILPSCNITKKMPEGKYLVAKNKIYITYNDSIPQKLRVKKTAPLNYIPLSQTPPKKFFGINSLVWLYLKANPDKKNWWNNTLRKMGQPPVYFDSTENEVTLNNMRIFMKSEGYLDAVVTDTIKYIEKKKKAYIDYYINPKGPYIISDLSYKIADSTLTNIILSDSINSLIKIGDIFSRGTLERERKRITQYMEDKGYYTFSVNDILYWVDTLHSTHTATVQVTINQNIVNRKQYPHKQYIVNKLTILPNFRSSLDSLTHFDTIKINKINYLYQNGKINIKPKTISKKIQINVDSLWSPKTTDFSISNLANLKYYKSTNIDYLIDNSQKDTTYGYLNGYIRLNPAKLHSIKAEGEVSSNRNYTSLIFRIGYSNKNIFKGSQQLDILFNASYDFFYGNGNKNAYEFGVTTSLSFPKLLAPWTESKNPKIFNTESKVSLYGSFQNRPYYKRNLANVTFGYKWSKENKLRFTYNPISISYISLPWVDTAYLNTITNPYLRNTYTNQLIAGTNFGLTYNNNRPLGSNYSLKFNVETSGNALYAGYKLFNAKTHITNDGKEKYYKLLGVRFAQYLRADIDFSHLYRFDDKNAIVWRVFAGAGFGYGNSKSMPFERLFYSGGSSSMRGWQIRTLGPGNKPTPVVPPGEKKPYPSSLGDIRLEANLEGRFQLFGPFRGAVFFDLGNIWSNGKGETDQSTIFHFNTFYKQLGLNTGIGLRLDLNFFVFRLDWGIKLHDPNRPTGERWVRHIPWKDLTAIHFAIGYPF